MSTAGPELEPGPSDAEAAPGVALPVVRVLRGVATAEEVAALSVLLAALGEDEQTPSGQRRGWSHRRRTLNLGASRGAGWGSLL
ncbi:MAG TPA: acyl-CoA carboxylase epsilon subunit [Dermatophilaceae bacterium]|nr:acyl-CoA carboxylase epsilon subunit [Dermatophilaceae bacterium]